jgi:proteasome lid subunit RPN8/RPN11
MRRIVVGRQAFESMIAHAESEYPFECCGFIISNAIDQVRAVRNIQNEKHRADPTRFPRDARTAFLMDPREQLAVVQEIDARRLKLKAVYHSHPDHDAYFSATDRSQACSFDPAEPDYPETAYIVISVRAGKFDRAAAFMWDNAKKDFVEADLQID